MKYNTPKHNRSRPRKPKPMAMVGSGPLTSAIWKSGDEQGGWRYRFNLFRQLAGNGHVSQLFQPADLTHLVKLTQVLAAVLADDGCLSARQRQSLRELATQLDEITQFWNSSDELADSGSSRCSSCSRWKGRHGDTTDS